MDASLQARAQQLAAEFAGQAQTVEDLNVFLRLMMKSGLERMLNTELDVHLGRRGRPSGTGTLPEVAEGVASEPSMPAESKSPPLAGKKRPPNRRNGHSQKTVQGDMGELTLSTPRDRDGTFEPQIIARHQRRVSGFDEKILALYAKRMTTRDIQEIVKDLYGVEFRRRSFPRSPLTSTLR